MKRSMIAVVSIAAMLMISAASASADTATYAGGSLSTTGFGYGRGSGTVYPGHFDLTQGDLTLIVYDVDMSASVDGTWTGSNVWNPVPNHKAGIQTGITNQTAIASGSWYNPSNSAYQNLVVTGSSNAYYLGQQLYSDASSSYQGPSLGWNTPFQGGGTPNGGTHGTGSVANDTFDLKIVYHDLGVGNGFQVTAYQSVHATTDPSANVANTWYPMYDSPEYQDVPESAVVKTDVQPFVFISNWELDGRGTPTTPRNGNTTGGGTVTWGNVEATGSPVPEPATMVLLAAGGVMALLRRKRKA